MNRAAAPSKRGRKPGDRNPGEWLVPEGQVEAEIQKARAEHLMIFCGADYWTPAEFRLAIAAGPLGPFPFGPSHFELRVPAEELTRIDAAMLELREYRRSFLKRIRTRRLSGFTTKPTAPQQPPPQSPR